MNIERLGVTSLFAAPFSAIGLFAIYLSTHATTTYGASFHDLITYAFIAAGLTFIIVGIFTGWSISKVGLSNSDNQGADKQ
jgi:hypothetical protein